MATSPQTSKLFDDGSVIAPQAEMGKPAVVAATAALLQELRHQVAAQRLSREDVGEVLRRVWFKFYQD
jgi:hypothetical protein